MIIRKKYTFNNGHIVRNCSSERCKFSIHAHTYSVEFFFTSNGLDNGSMVIDFGLLKNKINKIDAVWLTHPHSDHLMGIDDLRVFSFKSSIYPI